jgi:hypothetical protein
VKNQKKDPGQDAAEECSQHKMTSLLFRLFPVYAIDQKSVPAFQNKRNFNRMR